MTTLYLKADTSTIAPYVLLSGDPWRVEKVASYLDEPVHVSFSREFNTYTGAYKDVPITVSSTGIGAPSAAIALEELHEAGMRVAVRMGTSMTLDDKMLGQFIIPVAAMRREQTSTTYIEQSYPAVADIELLRTMNEAVIAAHGRVSNDVFCSMDGFYTQMHSSIFTQHKGCEIDKNLEYLRTLHVAGVDMETSCILTIARLMDVKACSVTLATVTRNVDKALEVQHRGDAEDLLCRVTLEGLYSYAHVRGSAVTTLQNS